MNTDQNLLFGVLAMKCELIDADSFSEACVAWSARRDAELADILVERGWITAEDREHLAFLLKRKLRQWNGDARKSLAASVDPTIRRVLESMEDAEIQHSIAELPPTRAAAVDPEATVAHRPKKRERYSLTRMHAKGGIGQVWLARDEMLGRDVALKELRPEQVENEAVWGRFLEEARVTGQLEHPGIVPVYELAHEPDGRKPYYTMRFIRGRTLNEAIREFHKKRANEKNASVLELHALLQAFLGVCNAVAYAHSRGVIHRDLKGQNVVLGDFGEAIVLDWGLAKLVNQPESIIGAVPVARNDDSQIAATLHGQALGTPGYMAPEQAEGRVNAIDRRTDVYGLGAMLYEILSGEPPFRGDDTAELLRRVVHESPSPPRAHNPTAPAPLQAICLKAIAKKPEDRYRRVEDLAADVRRYLADEPVAVYREPLTARLTRWGRRHRTAASSIGVLLVSAIAALAIGTLLINGERAKAEASFRKARQAVDEYFTKVSQSTLLNVPGLQPLRKELLESARGYYEDFLHERGTDPSVRSEAAEAWYRLGFLNYETGAPLEAAGHLQHAVEMYESLARDYPSEPRYPYKLAMSLNDLGNAMVVLGREADAERAHFRSLEIRARIAEANPEVAEYQKELAIGHHNYAIRLVTKGEIDAGLEQTRKAQAIYERLVDKFPDVADYRHRLSGIYLKLGSIDQEKGKETAALAWHQRALNILEDLVHKYPEFLQYRAALAGANGQIGFIKYRLVNQPAEALDSFRRAEALLKPLVDQNPSVAGYRTHLGHNFDHQGRILKMLGRPDDAMQAHEKARLIREELLREHPNVPANEWTLAYTYLSIGRLHQEAGHAQQAADFLRKARGIWIKLADEPSFDLYNRACMWALCAELTGAGQAELSPEDDATRARCADRAVSLLKEVVTGGFANANMIEQESDFDSIRSHPGYVELMRELRSRGASDSDATQVTGPARN